MEKQLEITIAAKVNTNDYTFSICTLVKDWKRYGTLKESLFYNGFINDKDEVLTIDNAEITKFDCYKGVNHFLKQSVKDFTIIIHDDVVFLKTRDQLIYQIEKITKTDPRAKVFGVVGTGQDKLHGSGHFFSLQGEEYWGFKNNGLVNSLDECFLLIDNSCGLLLSDDLSGFHFYGSDICINAELLGYNSYVLDFPINHLSPGNLNDDFLKARALFEQHLRKIKYSKIVNTTCTSVYGGFNKFHIAQSLAIAIVKPILGNNKKGELVKSKLEEEYRGKILITILMKIISIYILYKHSAIEFIYWDFIHPLSWPIRRIYGDISWWKNNWRSRLSRF